ncbi:hypothetical protein [Sphingomonas oryzagri]|uniref:Uncharacterized protein n=1 Tax=Sphingomonas oryzagri TaxID=3042314 RepID=A0ABT6N3J3_9SPHN|nr:hypothetical protein [Sphingomonas oryzagri]MDH7639334.1 hypothetical protein [Sphingomonas oryzagri]
MPLQRRSTPKGRTAAAAYVRAFIAEMKRSGQIEKDLKETGQQGVPVSPAA